MKRLFSIITLCFFCVAGLAVDRVLNCYGLDLERKADGSYTVKNLEKYCRRNPSFADQPGINEPFEPGPSKVIDEETIKDVITRDYVYKTYPDGRELKISVDFARSPKAAPVVFVTHGGSWKRGSRSSFNGITRTMEAKDGVTGVRIQYSFCGMPGVTMVETEKDEIERKEYDFMIKHL